MIVRSLLLAMTLGLCSTLAGGGCGPVKLPQELPGPPGCGKRDPTVAGPSTLSVAQNMTVKNMGMPGALEDNEHGGKTWLYHRQSGSVFGESATVEAYLFDAQGLLVGQKTEVRKQVGK
jgi:hypothetical protein